MRELMFSGQVRASGRTLVSCFGSLAGDPLRNALADVPCSRQRGRVAAEGCTGSRPQARSVAVSAERAFLVAGPCVALASKPNPSVERTVRLRRSAAHFQRWASSAT